MSSVMAMPTVSGFTEAADALKDDRAAGVEMVIAERIAEKSGLLK